MNTTEAKKDLLEEATERLLEVAQGYDPGTAQMALVATLVSAIAASVPHQERVAALEHYLPNMRSLLKNSPVTFDDMH